MSWTIHASGSRTTRTRCSRLPSVSSRAPAIERAPPSSQTLSSASSSRCTLLLEAAMPPRTPSSRPVTSTRASRTDTRERRPRGQALPMGPDRHTRGRPSSWPRSTTPRERSVPQPRVARGRAISSPRRWRRPRAWPRRNTGARRRRPRDDRRARHDRLVRPHAGDSRTGQRATIAAAISSRRRRPSVASPTLRRLCERCRQFSAASRQRCVSSCGRLLRSRTQAHGLSNSAQPARTRARNGGPSACSSATRTSRRLSSTPSALRPRLARSQDARWQPRGLSEPVPGPTQAESHVFTGVIGPGVCAGRGAGRRRARSRLCSASRAAKTSVTTLVRERRRRSLSRSRLAPSSAR